MKQFFSVLKFELANYFKTKGFWITNGVIMLLVLLFFGFTMIQDKSSTEENTPDESTWVVWDQTGEVWNKNELADTLAPIKITSVDNEDDFNKALVDETSKDGFIIHSATSYEYVVKTKSIYAQEPPEFKTILQALYRSNAITSMGLDYTTIDEIYQAPIETSSRYLEKDGASNFIYAYAMILIIYMIIIIYCQMIATSITVEKSNRSIEILVTSTNTTYLIFGKVLAGTIASIVQLLLPIGEFLLLNTLTGDNSNEILGFIRNMPPVLFVTFLVFGILGFILYAFMMAGLASLVSKTEDLSKSLTPAIIIYFIAFAVAFFNLSAGESMIMKVSSFIPFTSCYSMIARVAVGSVSTWEIILSAIILIATNIGMGIIVAKIYRLVTLMYGNPITLSNAFKFLKKNHSS